MKICFAIITKGTQDELLAQVVESIRAENIPDYEIIICGATEIKGNDIQNLPFNEEKYPDCISIKKNAIVQATKAPVLVFMHDYVSLEPGWWKGVEAFGFDWDICMTRILKKDGMRHLDWVRTSYRHRPGLPGVYNCSMVPYDRYEPENQYVPGNYWMVKRKVMIDEPLDNALRWAEFEDVEWSDRVLPKYRFVMNQAAAVRYLKEK